MQAGQYTLLAEKSAPRLGRNPAPADGLDGDAAIETVLHGLVNVAHAAAGNAPNDSELAQLSWCAAERFLVAGSGDQSIHLFKPSQLVCECWMAVRKCAHHGRAVSRRL